MNKLKYENELVFMSKYVGMRNDYVQAGGGNTSIKISDAEMIIKSSGVQLSEVSKDYGISYVEYKKIRDLLHIKDEKNTISINENSILEKTLIKGSKPSIETFLHSLTNKYTIHIHSSIINILTCQKDGFKILKNIFTDAIYVDYALPGIELAQKVFSNYKNNKPSLIFLKNHGIIVSGDSCEDTIKKLNNIVQKTADFLNIDITKYNNISKIYLTYLKVCSKFNNIIYLSEDENINLAMKKNNGSLWKYNLFPDSIVYCGLNPLKLQKCTIKEIEKDKEHTLIEYDENLYINSVSLKKAREIESVLSSTAYIFLNSKNKKFDFINNNEKMKIDVAESEKYRKAMV